MYTHIISLNLVGILERYDLVFKSNVRLIDICMYVIVRDYIGKMSVRNQYGLREHRRIFDLEIVAKISSVLQNEFNEHSVSIKEDLQTCIFTHMLYVSIHIYVYTYSLVV